MKQIFTSGPYEGKTFDQVASTRKGLIFLDEMVDWIEKQDIHIRDVEFFNDLCKYVKDPSVAEKIKEAKERNNLL